MQLGRRLIENTGFIFASNVLGRAFSFVFVVYAARVLGPGDFGLYALIVTAAFLFSCFGNLGIVPMAVRELSRDRERAGWLFSHVLSLRITVSLILYPAFVIAITLLGYSPEVKLLLYIIGLSTIFSTFSGSFRVLYAAFERFKTPALIAVLVSFLSNAANIAVLYLGYGLRGIVLVSLVGSATGAVITGIWVRNRIMRYRFVFAPSVWKGLLGQSMPFAGLMFVQQANRALSILFLSKLPGPVPPDVAMGYYNTPASLGRAALMLPTSFREAALPAVSANSGNLGMVKGIIDRSTSVLLAFVILPLILATTFFPKEIITVFFGAEYLPAAPALTIFGLAYALQVFNTPVSMTLSASREIKRFLPWAFLVFAFNVVLSVPLIIYYSFVGAAAAFLASMVLETFLRNHLLRSICGIERFGVQDPFFKTLPAMSVVFGAVLVASFSPLNTLWLICLSMTLYAAYVATRREFRDGVFAFISRINRRGRI